MRGATATAESDKRSLPYCGASKGKRSVASLMMSDIIYKNFRQNSGQTLGKPLGNLASNLTGAAFCTPVRSYKVSQLATYVTQEEEQMNFITDSARGQRRRTPLNRSQIAGFWGAWAGWTLDGMDSFIYALVLTPALTELLPRSGYAATPANVGLAGSILFALFLVGWGLSFIWGPLADRFGRTKVLAGTIFMFAIFTGLSATGTTSGFGHLPLPRGYRDWWGVGARGHLRRRGMARGSSKDGGWLPADGLLRRLLFGFGAQLHGRCSFRLAGYVPDRRNSRRRLDSHSAARERAREVEEGGGGARRGALPSVARNLLCEISAPYMGCVCVADDRDHRSLGGRRVRALRRYPAFVEGGHGQERCDQDCIVGHRLAIDRHDIRLHCSGTARRADRP